jgi:hypothetical protein
MKRFNNKKFYDYTNNLYKWRAEDKITEREFQYRIYKLRDSIMDYYNEDTFDNDSFVMFMEMIDEVEYEMVDEE